MEENVQNLVKISEKDKEAIRKALLAKIAEENHKLLMSSISPPISLPEIEIIEGLIVPITCDGEVKVIKVVLELPITLKNVALSIPPGNIPIIENISATEILSGEIIEFDNWIGIRNAKLLVVEGSTAIANVVDISDAFKDIKLDSSIAKELLAEKRKHITKLLGSEIPQSIISLIDEDKIVDIKIITKIKMNNAIIESNLVILHPRLLNDSKLKLESSFLNFKKKVLSYNEIDSRYYRVAISDEHVEVSKYDAVALLNNSLYIVNHIDLLGMISDTTNNNIILIDGTTSVYENKTTYAPIQKDSKGTRSKKQNNTVNYSLEIISCTLDTNIINENINGSVHIIRNRDRVAICKMTGEISFTNLSLINLNHGVISIKNGCALINGFTSVCMLLDGKIIENQVDSMFTVISGKVAVMEGGVILFIRPDITDFHHFQTDGYKINQCSQQGKSILLESSEDIISTIMVDLGHIESEITLIYGPFVTVCGKIAITNENNFIESLICGNVKYIGNKVETSNKNVTVVYMKNEGYNIVQFCDNLACVKVDIALNSIKLSDINAIITNNMEFNDEDQAVVGNADILIPEKIQPEFHIETNVTSSLLQKKRKITDKYSKILPNVKITENESLFRTKGKIITDVNNKKIIFDGSIKVEEPNLEQIKEISRKKILPVISADTIVAVEIEIDYEKKLFALHGKLKIPLDPIKDPLLIIQNNNEENRRRGNIEVSLTKLHNMVKPIIEMAQKASALLESKARTYQEDISLKEKSKLTKEVKIQKQGKYMNITKAREVVNRYKIKSQREWWEWNRNNIRPAEIPSDPAKVYFSNGWQGWKHFLGCGKANNKKERATSKTILTFEESRQYLKLLNITKFREWKLYLVSKERNPDIPFHPNLKYKAEWISWNHFLSNNA